ncbi:MAG: hypothetical protein ABIU97_08975 [Dehalococcoidia bacterium]
MMIDEPPIRNGGSRPVPDPTLLTDKAIAKAIDAERDYVNGQLDVLRERLEGIDRATELRLGGVTAIPLQIDEKVSHLGDLTAERFRSVDLQFRERDTRSERESKDNKTAVDAAFAAQKEAAAEQNKSNTLAITKSEVATQETINKLSELFTTAINALGDKIDDLKERTSRIESMKVGATESRTGLYATIGTAGVLFFVLLAVVGFLATRVP